MDIDSQNAQRLDELVGALSEEGWSDDEICARVRETYAQMEEVEDELESREKYGRDDDDDDDDGEGMEIA